MTTTPQPSKEAVEAAIVYAKHKDLTVESLAILDANAQTPWDSTMITAARVLAAEVERLREQLANERQGYVEAVKMANTDAAAVLRLTAERDEMKRRWHNSRRACRQQGKGLQLHARIMQLQAAETLLMRQHRDEARDEARQLRAEVERLRVELAAAQAEAARLRELIGLASTSFSMLEAYLGPQWFEAVSNMELVGPDKIHSAALAKEGQR